MTEYKAPLRDLRFVRDEILDFYGLWQTLPGCEDATEDIVNAILEEEAKFCENELVPLNQTGDAEGCTRHEDGSVTTPRGFKEAYQSYVAGRRCLRHWSMVARDLPRTLTHVRNMKSPVSTLMDVDESCFVPE